MIKLNGMKSSKSIVKELNIKIPNDYKEFLNQYHQGCEIEGQGYFYIEEIDDFLILTHFAGITNENSDFEIKKITSFFQGDDDIVFFEKHGLDNQNILVLANDPFGNPLIMSLMENSFGNLFYLYED